VRAAIEHGCAGSFVFAWTDEWYRGGHEVTGWEFGLTTRDRRPKPALEAVARAAAEPLASPQASWARVSVVICVYNGAATLADCLEGATALDYPDYEVIVVDDGSTDDTPRIANEFDVRLIRTENGGLSRARNIGIEAATGEIIAFTDADARPDADWLTYLALGLRSGEFVAVGGPNIAPPGDGLVAECVANAPGGPVYVLSTDQEAEHVPGCNMAFRASALREIGGFDPRFRTAGDDVDVCWRIQERGWRIGFSPSAVVWHHVRSTVAAYWRQQCGYGAAEALLAAKWPEKYNAAGHVTWGGRVYGPGVYPFPFTRSRIYGGTWGNAPFQSREVTPPGWLWEASAMPEWHLGIVVLAALTLCGLLWTPLLLALPLLILALGTTLARGVAGGARARFTELTLAIQGAPLPGGCARAQEHNRGYRYQRRVLTTLLHLLQPLARLRGRFLSGLVPWRTRVRGQGFAWPRTRRISLWREVGEAPELTLGRIEKRLAEAGAPVRRDDGYHEWDLEVEGGALGAARLRSCVEWHGGARQLVRFAVHPRFSGPAWVLAGCGTAVSAWALTDGAVAAAALLGSVVALVGVRSLWECGISVAVLTEAVHDSEAQRVGSGEFEDTTPLTTAPHAETALSLQPTG
jgi:GT2 family glycosyltransferase